MFAIFVMEAMQVLSGSKALTFLFTIYGAILIIVFVCIISFKELVKKITKFQLNNYH